MLLFEWDTNKANIDIERHGVTFDEARAQPKKH